MSEPQILSRGPVGATRSPIGATLRRLALPVLGTAVVLAGIALTSSSWTAWLGDASVQTTDDAVIQADISHLAARIAGNVLRMGVTDYQRVHAGDLLVEIDPADFQAQVAQAEATLAGAVAALANLENQKALQEAAIATAVAQRDAALAQQVVTQKERDRQVALLTGGVAGTRQLVEQATAAFGKAMADLHAAEAVIVAQRRQLDVLNGQGAQLLAAKQAAEAALQTAQLQLSYTRIVAPYDGMVGARQVQVGNYVTPGTALIPLVPLPLVYVMANYRETQLTHIAIGQPAEVTVDMFPGVVLRGHVDRTSPASGSTFSLLPPDNATGNFTKVVQRIPVRIALDPDQPLIDRLRPGSSVVASIRIRKDGVEPTPSVPGR
jgi:membrane fusion protein (multidrug efflux system)